MKKEEFKSPIKIPGGGEKNRCYYPLRLDAYGKGCGNNCLYCYARASLSFRKMWHPGNPAVTNVEKIEKLFEDVFELGKKRKYGKHLKAKIPLRMGGMTDNFQNAEEEHETTYRLIKLLNKYNYPYLILTKNTLVGTEKYINIMDKDLAYIQFTITTPYDDVAEVYEPGAQPPSEKLKAIKKLKEADFYVANRINPLFPMYSDGHFSNTKKQEKLFEKKDKLFRYFHWNLIDELADVGTDTVIAGFLRLSTWNIKWIEKATGKNLEWLFDPNIKQKNQALHFSTEEKRYYYEKIKEKCDNLGMQFSVCYDGDEDYEEFRYLWADKNDCCNGRTNVKGFGKTFNFVNPDFIESDEN